MAAARIKSGTVSGVTSVTLDQAYSRVEVLNRDATNEIFFTVDGTTPTVDGDNCFCVTAKGALEVPCNVNAVTVVKMINSAGTPKYSLIGSGGPEIRRS